MHKKNPNQTCSKLGHHELFKFIDQDDEIGRFDNIRIEALRLVVAKVKFVKVIYFTPSNIAMQCFDIITIYLYFTIIPLRS